MSLLYRVGFGKGYTEVVSPDNSDLKLIEFGVLTLAAGEEFALTRQRKELVGVILSGKCSVTGKSFSWKSIGGRRSVFDGRATGFYLPIQTAARVKAETDCSIAIARAPASKRKKPVLVTPDEVVVRDVGAHNWKRSVQDVVGLNVDAERLVVGETFNPPGNWSSYPPHRHDIDRLPVESEQEEVYYFKISPPQGFGVQRIYTEDGKLDEIYALRDNDVVAIPRGFHPVGAAPGYRLYYLWILAGEKRILQPFDDPAHGWVKNCEPIIGGME